MGLTDFFNNAIKTVSSGANWVMSSISKAINPNRSNSSGKGGFGGGGGGVMTDSNNNGDGSGSGNKTSGSNDASGGSGSGSSDSGDMSSNDNTTKNVIVNDPEKNKLLAEVRMMEELRKTFEVTIRLPKILKGLHTNSWLFLEIGDDFYDDNYRELMELVAKKKYGRYAGFKKGRFFVEKIVEKGGVDGVSMEITLNPIASSYGQYVKMQLEAEKALVDALNDNNSYSNNGGLGAGGSVNMSTLDEIYKIAATFKYGGAGTGLSPEKAWAYYQRGGRVFDCYDCSNWLFYCLREKKIPCRIVQGYSPYSGSNTHRVVQIYENGTWHCPKQAWTVTTNLKPFTPEDKYSLKTLLEYNGD